MKKYVVAIVGATGVVGKELADVLAEQQFPIETLIPLASERSAGSVLQFKDEALSVQTLTEASFEGVDFALFSAGGSVSAKYVPHAVKSGAVCIDNTSHFRMFPDVPLVVPEVNAHALRTHKGIIANPNCSTAQLVLVLKAMHDVATLKRVVVSTYQSVSGAGKEAIEELEGQARRNLSGGEYPPKEFTKPIAFNLIPQIDVFLDNGYTKEEIKMIEETRKIMGLPDLRITATAVRVPVFVGHSESINVELEKPLSPDQAREALSRFPGIAVMDDPKSHDYPTPREIAGQDPVFVGRIRQDMSVPHGLDLWCVADNLRKGAALNAVQIAQALIKQR